MLPTKKQSFYDEPQTSSLNIGSSENNIETINKIISENFLGVSIKMEKEVDVEDKISKYVLADIDN